MGYQTKPSADLTTWPKGIPYIIGNEGCERFSYYGMNAILYVYLVSMYATVGLEGDASGNLATSTIHLFKTGVYAFPLIGAIIADRFLGKYQTIIWLSLVYCLGHLVLAVTEGSLFGLQMGLLFIAIGSGGIKPCVSANVGDQFGKSNWHLVRKVYQMFYFIINFGSFFAVIFIPLLKEWFGFRVAFGVPGVLMFIATVVFWMGRKDFVHVPPSPGGKIGLVDSLSSILLLMSVGSLVFTVGQPGWIMASVSLTCLALGMWLFAARQRLQPDNGFLAVATFSVQEFTRVHILRAPALAQTTVMNQRSGPGILIKGVAGARIREKFGEEAVDGALAVIRVMTVFAMVTFFWSLFEQHSSSWIRQAIMMNLTLDLPLFGQVEILASQVPSMNPILVMLLIPFLNYAVYPVFEKMGIKATPLRRMTFGMGLASVAFAVVALLQLKIDGQPQHSVSVAWQLLPYILITLAEVLVSVTGLEFAYTQAPQRMKSTIMSFWLLTIAVGNMLVALTAKYSDLKLENFFWLFAFLMAIATCIFGMRAVFYHSKEYPQS